MTRTKFATLVVLMLVSSWNVALASDPEVIVENSVGKLIVLQDRWTGHVDGVVSLARDRFYYEEFLPTYENLIADLPVANRVDFLWSAMWHLGFDGHIMMDFQGIVLRDCRDEFIDRLQNYIETESQVRAHISPRLYLSEKVLGGLKHAIGD